MKLHKEVFEGMMSTAFNGSIEWALTELAAMRCLKIILEEAEDYDDLPFRFKGSDSRESHGIPRRRFQR